MTIDRRRFVVALGAGTLTASLGAFAQQPQRVPRLGYLISETLSDETSRVEALRAGLREYGFVEGRNIAIEIRTADGKYDRLPELAAELVGLKVARVALLVNPANASSQRQLEEVRATANALKLELLVLETRNAGEIREALATMTQRRIDAVVISSDTLLRANADAIVGIAARQRIPVAGSREFGVSGGLIGYGVDPVELYRRGAYFIDRLLKGAKPADLPIERATKLDLVINLKTAKLLGVTVPQSLLLRANEVIQ